MSSNQTTFCRISDTFNLDINEICIFAACMASTDILISQGVARYKFYPIMFSVILGAGLWNDSIIVVMTQVFSEYTCPVE